MATTAAIRSSGSTASTSRWSASSTPASPRKARSSRASMRGPKAMRSSATATTCCRSTTRRRRGSRRASSSIPFARTREALVGVARGDSDPHFGYKLRYRQPGDRPLADADDRHLRAAAARRDSRRGRVRSSDSTGLRLPRRRRPGDDRRQRRRRGTGVRLRARATSSSCRRGTRSRSPPSEDTMLFSFSDRPVQEVLGLWREERMA